MSVDHLGIATAWRAHVKTAVLSTDARYRYRLTRRMPNTTSTRIATIVMVNPSTADALKDDATIRKLYGLLRPHDIGHFIVVNVCAYRATRPRDLRTVDDAVGPDNAFHLTRALSEVDVTICAWGRTAPRQLVADLLPTMNNPQAFRLLRDGTPEHPLYIPYGLPLVAVPRWTWPTRDKLHVIK